MPARPPITVADVMLAPVLTLRADATLQEALRLLQREALNCLAVGPLQRAPHYAALARRDVLRAASGGQPPEQVRLGPLVQPKALVVAPAMRLEDCSVLLTTLQLRAAVVLNEGHPVGIICDNDIFQAIEARTER